MFCFCNMWIVCVVYVSVCGLCGMCVCVCVCVEYLFVCVWCVIVCGVCVSLCGVCGWCVCVCVCVCAI